MFPEQSAAIILLRFLNGVTDMKQKADIFGQPGETRQGDRPSAVRISAAGSFTVEAAMILFLVIQCIMLAIYGCMYLHDRNILETAAVQTAARSRLEVSDCEDFFTGRIDWESYGRRGVLWMFTDRADCAQAELYALSLVSGKLAVSRGSIFTTTASVRKADVRYSAEIPLLWIFEGAAEKITRMSGKASAAGAEPEELIRLIQAVGDEKRS